MLNVRTQWNAQARKGATAAAVVLFMSLAACGGNSSSAASGAGPGASTGGAGNDAASISSIPSANASFFDGIFLKDSGTGYYQFDANFQGGNVKGTGNTAFYVNTDGDSNFSTTSSPVAGTFSQRYVSQVYITSEGAYASQSTPYTDIGTNSKIFSKLPQGYELGMQGMSSPLYQVTVNPQDVSGQPVSQVLYKDEGPGTNGLNSLLFHDNTPMPQGSKIYQTPYSVLTTHLWVNLTAKLSGFGSLEQIQTATGGTIRSLGGYRYLQPTPDSAASVEYNGAIYYGELLNAGEVHDVDPTAYNRVAAEFIAQREAAALGQ
jgi:hypothetical protein